MITTTPTADQQVTLYVKAANGIDVAFIGGRVDEIESFAIRRFLFV